ncbi:hypothetical protein [Rubritalea tangerina]|uniref:hypothetical protein n=1 Tax=Rubritalea tangerina TaxID=430798 RepID=UPI003621C7E6
MRRKLDRRVWWFIAILFVYFAFLTFIPGISYDARSISGSGIIKKSRGLYNSFRVYFPQRVIMYEWNPLATHDPCWGPEGLSSRKGGFYFRFRTFELSSFRRRP